MRETLCCRTDIGEKIEVLFSPATGYDGTINAGKYRSIKQLVSNDVPCDCP